MQQDDEKQETQPVEERPDLANIKHATATPTVSWTCPECGKIATVESKRLLMMVLQGQGAIIKCPLTDCGKFVSVEGEKAAKPLIVAPTVAPTNREGRRALESLGRRGLLHVKR